MKKRYKKQLKSVGIKPNPGFINIPESPKERVMLLVNLMASVKTDTEEAKLNATTISDNNGGRILL